MAKKKNKKKDKKIEYTSQPGRSVTKEFKEKILDNGPDFGSGILVFKITDGGILHDFGLEIMIEDAETGELMLGMDKIYGWFGQTIRVDNIKRLFSVEIA